MALPAAPTASGGEPLLPLVYDNAATNSAAVVSTRKTRTVNSEVYGEMDVYPTSGSLENGAQTLAGASAEVLGANIPCQGVLIKADPNNTGTVYVGKSDVTTDWADSTGGFPVEPGASVGVPCRNVNEVFIIGTASDRVAWLASAD